jgi:hypothetical protein
LEFVPLDELGNLLDDHGLTREEVDDAKVLLQMEDGDSVVHLHLTSDPAAVTPRAGATVINVSADDLAGTVDHVLQRLHLTEVVLIPVGKWRSVFDAVAFSLADNEEWQRIDAAAAVELNTRDPLLCEAGEYHTLAALIKALLSDADQPEQGVSILSPASPIHIEIVPESTIRISVGNRALADEVTETLPEGSV